MVGKNSSSGRSAGASRGLPIRFLVTREGRATIRKLLLSCDSRLRVAIDMRLYARALGPARPPSRRRFAMLLDGVRRLLAGIRLRYMLGGAGARHERIFVFADIERLSWDERRRSADLYRRLDASPGVRRILNHPTRSHCRYELLRALHRRGWNDFNVYRVSEGLVPERFPVFIRGEDDHGGAISPLIASPDELIVSLERRRTEGRLREGTLIVEFCDTADELGLIRKFGAFRVGDRILPKHIFISRQWMLKSSADSTGVSREAMARLEATYLRENPHEEELMARFELAEIEYGRIDYGLKAGRVQVWEINTNPTIFLPEHFEDSVRRPIHEAFEKSFREALIGLGEGF